MEITLDREQAMKAVSVAKTFAAGASGLKVVQGVLVSAESGRARLVTTDLDLWCQVDLDAQTPGCGEVLVPVRSLETMFKNTPQSRVQLRSEGEGVVCEAGSSEMRLQGLDVEDYPDVGPPDGCLLEMPLAAAVIDKVAYAVSRDETRYTLCGVRLEVEGRHLKLVATDGHRLARFQGMLPPGSVCDAGEEPLTATLPVRLLTEGVRLAGKLGCSATFELYEKAAAIRINGSIRIWSQLIEGQYPAYEEAIPSEYTGTVSVPKGALCSAVSRLGALSKGRRCAGLALSVEESRLVLRLAADAEGGIAAVERLAPARTQGSVPACGLRISYISEALARLPDVSMVDVKFPADKGCSPVAIQGPESSGSSVLAVIMSYELPA